MEFNKRWKAELYIFWLKVRNRFIHKNMSYEKYGIEHILPSNKYKVIELIITPKLDKELADIFKSEIDKEIAKSNKP
jgi:hypothetical protein